MCEKEHSITDMLSNTELLGKIANIVSSIKPQENETINISKGIAPSQTTLLSTAKNESLKRKINIINAIKPYMSSEISNKIELLVMVLELISLISNIDENNKV